MVRRSTLLLLVIFVALLAITIYIQRSPSREDATATPTEENPLLFAFEQQITGLRLEHVGSDIIELAKDDQGAWKLTMPETEETDVGAVESAISQLLSLRIVSSLGQEPGLEQAGLAPPAYQLVIKLEDGSQQSVSIGDETPTGSGYYVKVDDRGLFVISTYSLDPFLRLVDEPPIMSSPTPPAGMEPAPYKIPTTAP